jgi:tripartite-type tricarboxylate transporter receptor subunit TctC
MTVFRTITAVLIWIAAFGSASAETWPQRYVRIIVPFSAGGAADVVTRIVAAHIAENLGKNVVVENRTGSNGNIGTEAVARSEPDGYTFLAGSPGTLAINPHMFAKLPYNALTDFVAVSHVATFPQILAVSRKIPAANLSDFTAHLKARPKALNFGSSGIGSTGHLITAMFLHRAGLDAVHIPFRGGGPAAQALVAGDVDFVIDGLPTFQGFVGTDKVSIVAITSAKRSPNLPDVPAIGEMAVPGFDLSSWVVFAAPKGTPKNVADRFAAEVNKVLASDEVKNRLLEVGALPAGGSPEDAARFQRSELAKWKEVVEVSGAKME